MIKLKPDTIVMHKQGTLHCLCSRHLHVHCSTTAEEVPSFLSVQPRMQHLQEESPSVKAKPKHSGELKSVQDYYVQKSELLQHSNRNISLEEVLCF